jgi:molecular chaperone DnaK
MTITGGSALSKEEIERMVKDAEAHAEEDKQRREEADIRNAGDSLAYTTEKFIKDNEEKLSAPEHSEKKAEVETALADLKKLLEGADFAGIKSATEKVSELSQQLGAALYASQGAETNSAGSEKHDGVDEAEVVEE